MNHGMAFVCGVLDLMDSSPWSMASGVGIDYCQMYNNNSTGLHESEL